MIINFPFKVASEFPVVNSFVSSKNAIAICVRKGKQYDPMNLPGPVDVCVFDPDGKWFSVCPEEGHPIYFYKCNNLIEAENAKEAFFANKRIPLQPILDSELTSYLGTDIYAA